MWIPSGPSHAQHISECSPGEAVSYLDANNVRASIYNAGNLFWRSAGNMYTVPKDGDANAIFATSFWLGGMVGGELRFSGTDYGPFAFIPGPLTDDGDLPNPSDCSPFDRIYEITARELRLLDEGGEATEDILEWPWQLGAPVEDGDGDPGNYDLAGGDRPAITGHEMHWSVMNDLAGPPRWSDAPPLGVEVRSSAFAVQSTDLALNNTTFYRFEITNPQAYAIDSAYVGLWVDVDLGNAMDDFVGSDTTLGMGFGYNGDNFDDWPFGYGDEPPAMGVDIVQGPLAIQDGIDNDEDGQIDEEEERLSMTTFLYYQGSSGPNGELFEAAQAYNYMRAVWRDGTHLTIGGDGHGGEIPINFSWPGDPVTQAFWSEENLDGAGARYTPADRRFIIASGPFQLVPGETEEIVIAIVWAKGSDRLDSVTELRAADRTVQATWDAGTLGETEMPSSPLAGPTPVSPADDVEGQPRDITLAWEPQDHVSDYVVEVAESPDLSGPSHRAFTTIGTSIDVDSLNAFTDYFWRVTGRGAVFSSPPSTTMHFRTSDATLASVDVQRIPGTDDPAFVEIRGPGGRNPCGLLALSKDGCAETGGNLVYRSENSTGDYVVFSPGYGVEQTIGAFAPNDFEIRFTEEGSYAMHVLASRTIGWVPFELWDIGPVGFFNPNDPSDDVRLVPFLIPSGGVNCEFGYGEGPDPLGSEREVSDRIYAYYADSSYEVWQNVVESLVQTTPDACFEPADDAQETYLDLLDTDRGIPLQRIVFIGDPAEGSAPGAGTIVRFYTTPPPSYAPIPAAPASGTGPFDQPLELNWNAPRGHTTAQLQVSAEPSFKNPVLDAETGEESFVISGLEEGRTFHWRVRLSEPEGPWSDVWTFTAGEVTNVRAETRTELPTELTLDQNYPNPFNPSTTIRFGLPESGRVQIEIYDLLGRRIATLLDDTRAAGWHEVTWDADRQASGIYIYTIQTEQRRRTRSMIMLR